MRCADERTDAVVRRPMRDEDEKYVRGRDDRAGPNPARTLLTCDVAKREGATNVHDGGARGSRRHMRQAGRAP